MNLIFGYLVWYTPIYLLIERKKGFHVQNCQCGTVGTSKISVACKKSGFKSYRPLVGPIAKQGSCTITATKSHQMCAATVYS